MQRKSSTGSIVDHKNLVIQWFEVDHPSLVIQQSLVDLRQVVTHIE